MLKQSNEAQKNPKEIFGLANFGPDWPRLNRLTRGIQPKTFTVLAARPKVGKSTFISQMLPDFAIQARDEGKVLRVVTLETTMATYLGRTAANLAKIQDPLRVRAGMLEPWEQKNYKLALKSLNGLPIEFLSNEYDMQEDETLIGGYSAIGMDEIEAFIRQDDTFFWVVDHMGLINRRNMGKNTMEQLEGIANKLTVVANRYVGGIGITHLNRNALDGGPPGIENIAGTDVFARNAGAMYLLWRPMFESRRRTPEDLELVEALGGDHGLIRFSSRSEGSGSVGIFWRNAIASFEETDMREEDIIRPGAGREGTRREGSNSRREGNGSNSRRGVS